MEPNIVIPLRRSLCTKRPTISNDYAFLYERDFSISQSNDLNSIDEAMSFPDSDYWLTLMQDDLKSIHDNDVRDLVDILDDSNLIDCKQVFKT